MDIRKAKAKLLQLNGQELSEEEGDKFLEAVEFITFSTDAYLPQVGRELTNYLSQVAAHCSDPHVLLEVIRRLKEIADCFHKNWEQKDVELISYTLHGIVERFPQRRRGHVSSVTQSALAVLKDLSSYKDLQQKKLTTIPRQLLKPTDQIDAAPPAKEPRLDVQEGTDVTDASTEFNYYDLMQKLAEATDDNTVLQLESQLADLGYEANVL